MFTNIHQERSSFCFFEFSGVKATSGQVATNTGGGPLQD